MLSYIRKKVKRERKQSEIKAPSEYFMSKGNVYLYDMMKNTKYGCLNFNKQYFFIKGARSKTMNITVKTKGEKNDFLFVTGQLSNYDNYYVSITKCANNKSNSKTPIYKCEVNVTINAEKLDLYPYPPHVLYVFP